MVLIVGGEGSGKRSYAAALGYRQEDMADACLDERPVVFHVEKMAFARPDGTEELYRALLEKEVVICNEVGSGVIPIDRGERLGREAAGRLCILLARKADAVVRMVCGIPAVIKGELL